MRYDFSVDPASDPIVTTAPRAVRFGPRSPMPPPPAGEITDDAPPESNGPIALRAEALALVLARVASAGS
jgi:hypothetical protein